MAKAILEWLDDTPTGRVKFSIDSKTEIIYKIPRKSLAKCANINELSHGGIYLLLGGERDGRQMIYIGHGIGGLFDKLCEHDRADKNFFTEAIVFTTADNTFGAREIIWLEDKFFDELKGAGRLVVKIGKDEKSDDFEGHAEFARLALDTIGYKIFATPPDEEIFYLERYVKRIKRTIHAKMKRTPTGYRVLAGSEICPIEDGNRPLNVRNARQLAKVDCGILLEDVEFPKPSTAAEFVLGRSANGYEVWKTKDGMTLDKVLGR